MTPNNLALIATVAGKPMTVRAVGPSDQAAVLQLHDAVFASGAKPDWYAWKYSPAQGGGHAIGVWSDDRLIAHCGGLPRQLRAGSETVSGLQIGDVMVAPDWRGLMTRSSPFFHASNVLYSHWIGPNTDHAVGYGYPNHRHQRLAVKQGLAWDAGAILALQWDGADQPGEQPGRHNTWRRWARHLFHPLRHRSTAVQSDEIPIQALMDRDDLLACSWSAMQSDADASHVVFGVRDVDYLSWRYLRHPTQAYRCLCLFDSRGHNAHDLRHIIGLAFWRLDGDTAIWLDWVGPMRWLPEALRHCQTAATRAGAKRLSVWMSPVAASMLGEPLPSTQITQSTVISSRVLPGSTLTISEVARVGVPQTSCWPPGGEVAVKNTLWWWMGGDTDFL